MGPVDFCFWLKGLFDLGAPTKLNADQTALIKARLDQMWATTDSELPVQVHKDPVASMPAVALDEEHRPDAERASDA